IRDALTARMGEITLSVVASIRQQIPFYADAGAVSEEMVTAAVHDNLSYMVRALTDTTFDTAPAAATGRTRAEIGVPLAAVMHAYRIGVHRVWQE
ncbi:PucR family transcriptional regulator, partial [Mycobacterium kansasii]